MKKPAFLLRPTGQRHGSALIICLSMVVIMSILLVGYANTARNERVNASVHVAGQKAQIFASMATNHARATLLAAVAGNGAGTEPPFATGPGRLVRLPTATGEQPQVIDFTSGTDGTNAAIDDITVAINGPGLLSTKGAILPESASTFPVRWIYVRKDGKLESGSTAPAYNAANPLIGRYAFYGDDESARVNLNTAWTRDAANAANPGHPSKIDLRGAIESTNPADVLAEANALNARRQNNPLASTLSALGVDNTPLLKEAMEQNPASFTHYNHATSTNVFGKLKRVLTTKASVANGAPFFDILKNQSVDPGDYHNGIDTAKVTALINEIYADLKRTDWPMLPGKSFVDKYGPLGTAQIALDIIEYVRSCESNRPIVEPIRGTFDVASGKFTVNSGAATNNSLIGNTRRLYVTEMAVEFPQTPEVVEEQGQPTKKEYHVKYWIELYYPAPHPALGGTMPGAVNLASTKIFFTKFYESMGGAFEQPIAAADLRAMGSATASMTMNPGDCRVVVKTVVIPETADMAQNGPSAGRLRVAISRTATPDVRYNVVPLDGSSHSTGILYPVAPGKPIDEIQSAACDDPRANNAAADWKLGASTFGSPNASSVGNASTATPEQDTQSGVITDISVGPPRMGMPITSVGMLGFLHTGVTGPSAGQPGVPWRTLRLQPKNDQSKTMLPDWAMLDLFEAPQTATTAATRPRPNTIGGLVNPNTALYPFGDDATTPAARPQPMQALLTQAASTISNNTPIAKERAIDLAENIAQKKLAGNGVDYSDVAASQGTPFYAYPGELLEIEGIADGGEESEALAREVLALATTRSDVFRVYAIGQSVRQSAAGTINVVAEQKTMSLLEREGNKARVVYEQDWGL